MSLASSLRSGMELNASINFFTCRSGGRLFTQQQRVFAQLKTRPRGKTRGFSLVVNGFKTDEFVVVV